MPEKPQCLACFKANRSTAAGQEHSACVCWHGGCCAAPGKHCLGTISAKGVLGAGSVRCRALQVCVFALLLAARKFVKPEMTE